MATRRISAEVRARAEPLSRRARLEHLDLLSRTLDIAFAVPGTNFRFGVEAILRLVPGIGDVAASALSCWLLYEASRLGVPRHVLVRMIANVVVEGMAGSVPVVGDCSTWVGAQTAATSAFCASISKRKVCCSGFS